MQKLILIVRRWLVVLLLLPCISQAELNIQHWVTNNGARVYFVESHDLPIVDMRIVFDAGSAREGNKFGLAAITNNLMPAGSKNYTEDQLANVFEDNGAEFGNTSLRDMSLFTLRSLAIDEQLNPVTDALADILLNPVFPHEAFERDRKRALVGLKAEEQDQGTVANKIFMRELYRRHPYGHSPSGTIKSMQTLTVDDLRAYHKKFFVAKNATVAIVGNLDLLKAKNLVNKLVGRLPAGVKPVEIDKVEPLAKASKIDTDFPSTQTHILIGQPGISRHDSDYFPLYVGNHILGGSGLISRISEQIREKRGLAYSPYSYFSPMRVAGPFQIGMQTKNKNKAESLKILKQIVTEFIANGPTARELENSKKNIIGGFPLRLDSNKKQVEYVALIGFYNLPLDYLNTFSNMVAKVTVAEIKDAWQRRIKPDSFVTVTVGGDK